jgi:hypothetical protein
VGGGQECYPDDPLYLMTLLGTLGMCTPATIPLMARRGTRTGVGQSLTIWEQQSDR